MQENVKLLTELVSRKKYHREKCVQCHLNGWNSPNFLLIKPNFNCLTILNTVIWKITLRSLTWAKLPTYYYVVYIYIMQYILQFNGLFGDCIYSKWLLIHCIAFLCFVTVKWWTKCDNTRCQCWPLQIWSRKEIGPSASWRWRWNYIQKNPIVTYYGIDSARNSTYRKYPINLIVFAFIFRAIHLFVDFFLGVSKTKTGW